jgi:hypothetical protein
MPFVVEILRVDRNDRARHVTGFGIPADVVAQFEWMRHAGKPPCVDAASLAGVAWAARRRRQRVQAFIIRRDRMREKRLLHAEHRIFLKADELKLLSATDSTPSPY